MNDEGKIYTETRTYSARGVRKRTTSNQQLEKRRWLRKLLLGFLLVGLLIGGWFKLTNPATLPVHQVKIEGNFSHIDRSALRETILPFIDKGFLGVDVVSLQDRLQQLPWVYSATIKRIWPDTVVITLVEQRPIARFNANALLNQYGELFSVDATQMSTALPLFTGPVGQQILMWQTYQKLTTLLAPIDLKITILGLDARQSWRLQLSNGIVLFLGKINPEQRLQRFVATYPQIVGSKAAQINYVDLRYPHGMAVGLKN